MSDLITIYHKDCLFKDNGPRHPERQERVQSVLNSIKNIKNISVDFRESSLAKLSDISLVHPEKYINNIFSRIPLKGLVGVEQEPYADTFLCPYSKNAILRACGSGIDAANYLFDKENNKKIFCAVRPPGHHAETKRANGFCFINNVAVTARYLQKNFKIKRIAIIDFDVHHGNGTQEIFYNDGSVVYGSIHQSPLFPGTGLENENGVGNIFNAPILAGINGNKFIEIFENKILKKINLFKPEIILISAGFDAHKRDPLSQINLESKDFKILTNKIVNLANKHSNGRIISFLEGGYDLIALSESVKEHVIALTSN